jgi:D-3-phosphoglycerate dehydrogenase
MLEKLYSEPQKVLIVGDVRLSPDTIEAALRNSPVPVAELKQLFWGPETDGDAFSVMQLSVERGGSEAEAYAEGFDDAIRDATLLIVHMCPVPRTLLEKAEHLNAVLVCRGGVENVNADAAAEMGIPVVNVIRNAISVAEFAVGLIISVTRNIAASHHKIRSGIWTRDYPNSAQIRTLGNLTTGFLGMGNIGIELAKRLKALGTPMLAYDAWLDPKRLADNGLEDIRIVEDMESVFRDSDIVSVHLRLTPETAGLIDRRFFSLMKPTSYFINTARGGLVNQDELCEALRERRIYGAALDVFDSEPLRADSGLELLDNVTLTSHIAGTTWDALHESPVNLLKELDRIVRLGATERIVNYAGLRL